MDVMCTCLVCISHMRIIFRSDGRMVVAVGLPSPLKCSSHTLSRFSSLPSQVLSSSLFLGCLWCVPSSLVMVLWKTGIISTDLMFLLKEGLPMEMFISFLRLEK